MTMSPTPRRTLVAAAPALVACGAVLVTYLSLRDRLPDRLATHIGPDGSADAFDSPGAFLAVIFGVQLGFGALFAYLVHWIRSVPGQQRVLAVIGGGAAVLTGWMVVALLRANAAVGGDAGDVRFSGWQAVVGFAAAAVYGLIGWVLCGKNPAHVEAQPTATATATAPRLGLRDTEVAAWSRLAGSRTLPALGIVLLAVGLVIGVTAGWPSGLTSLVPGGVMVLLSGARVTVDRRGITVTPAVAPWPRLNVPLERITEASARRVDAFRDFGGWGYRARPGASGIVLRSGEAISARLTTGDAFVVTVDDAATAAALLNTLADRRRADGG